MHFQGKGARCHFQYGSKWYNQKVDHLCRLCWQYRGHISSSPPDFVVLGQLSLVLGIVVLLPGDSSPTRTTEGGLLSLGDIMCELCGTIHTVYSATALFYTSI